MGLTETIFFVEKRLFVSFYVIIDKILGILCIILYDSGHERGIAEGNTNFNLKGIIYYVFIYY
ncbi:hypothetical protein ABIA61_005005 [Paenibacillus sp. RC21]